MFAGKLKKARTSLDVTKGGHDKLLFNVYRWNAQAGIWEITMLGVYMCLIIYPG